MYLENKLSPKVKKKKKKKKLGCVLFVTELVRAWGGQSYTDNVEDRPQSLGLE